MPVSTRSQIGGDQDNPSISQQARTQTGQQPKLGPLFRNPHHGLKEKLKALTLFHQQQQQQTTATKNVGMRFSTHPSVELSESQKKEDEDAEQRCVKRDIQSQLFVSLDPKPVNVEREAKREHVMKERENQLPVHTVTKQGFFLGATVEGDIAKEKENLVGFERLPSYSCPKKDRGSAAGRSLSMRSLRPSFSEMRRQRESRTGPELGTVSEKCGASSRILVFVRLRPMAKKEREAGARCCVRIVNRAEIYLTEFATENDYLRLKRVRGRHFTFDASFPDSTTQQEVYTTTAANLVESVLQGRNGSVFCYGATGAGKTYTMLGTVENPGVMVLAIKDLFAKIRQRSCDGGHVVHLSYLEVYNESVRDLLSPGRPLVLREDKQGIVAAGLSQYRAYSTDEVMALLQQGNQNRTTEPTRANETSSRSHAILQVIAEYRVKEGAAVLRRMGKLSLIDLAGSERALATDQRTLRSLEGANINRSLLALSSCINALVEGKKHIPYRNSKLTQLLKDSVGGTCNTVMIANISPSNLSLGETQNTLHWADRAKEIRTKVCTTQEEVIQAPESETHDAKLIHELQKANHELKLQLACQKQKLLAFQAESVAWNSSPVPLISSLLTSPCSDVCQKPKTPLVGSCTLATKMKEADEIVQELKHTVKVLELEIERLKKDHTSQIKQRDDFIMELSNKYLELLEKGGREERLRVVTRACLKPKEQSERSRIQRDKAPATGELKSPRHRFVSPLAAARKRSFWDITTTDSPFKNLNGRKTRTRADHAPSMLLQPGFSRQRPEPPRR